VPSYPRLVGEAIPDAERPDEHRGHAVPAVDPEIVASWNAWWAKWDRRIGCLSSATARRVEAQ
jgi:hypothetical protein